MAQYVLEAAKWLDFGFISSFASAYSMSPTSNNNKSSMVSTSSSSDDKSDICNTSSSSEVEVEVGSLS